MLSIFLLTVAACSGSGDVSVSGTVTQKSKPVADAIVTFIPAGETKGLGGHAKTGPDGKYTLRSARGDAGIFVGEYKVTISRFVRPDGTPGDPNVPPIESDAREVLPSKYSSRDATTLKANVEKGSQSYDFNLD